jgi:hypothetical protein
MLKHEEEEEEEEEEQQQQQESFNLADSNSPAQTRTPQNKTEEQNEEKIGKVPTSMQAHRHQQQRNYETPISAAGISVATTTATATKGTRRPAHKQQQHTIKRGAVEAG